MTQSLADFLGLDDAYQPSGEDVVDYALLSGQEFAQKVLASAEFRAYIMRNLVLDSLPPPILAKLMDHGWGKPADKVEFEDKTKALESLTPEEFRPRIKALLAALVAGEDS